MILKMKKGKSNLLQPSFPSRCARKIVPYSCSFWLHNCCILGYLRVTKENKATFAVLPYYISHNFCFNQNPKHFCFTSASASHNRLLLNYQTQLPFFSMSG